MWYRSNRCGKYAKHGTIACSHHVIKEDILKNIILEDIRSISCKLNKEDILAILEHKIKKSESMKQNNVRTLDNEIEKLNIKKRRYIDMLAEGILSKDDYHETIASNQIKLEELYHQKKWGG